MNQKVIKVILRVSSEQQDVLSFVFDENSVADVCLNEADCQSNLKNVFSRILIMEMEAAVFLQLEIEDGYSKGLYIDVCTEYINDLNREIEAVRAYINNELQRYELR